MDGWGAANGFPNENNRLGVRRELQSLHARQPQIRGDPRSADGVDWVVHSESHTPILRDSPLKWGIDTGRLNLRGRSLVPLILLHAIYNLAVLAIASIIETFTVRIYQ